MLDKKLWGDARVAQEQRRVVDPWEDILVDMGVHQGLNGIIHKSDDGFERVASADVLAIVLQIPEAQQNSAHGQRLALALKHIGWDRNPSGLVKINNQPVRGYVRRSPMATYREIQALPAAPPAPLPRRRK